MDRRTSLSAAMVIGVCTTTSPLHAAVDERDTEKDDERRRKFALGLSQGTPRPPGHAPLEKRYPPRAVHNNTRFFHVAGVRTRVKSPLVHYTLPFLDPCFTCDGVDLEYLLLPKVFCGILPTRGSNSWRIR